MVIINIKSHLILCFYIDNLPVTSISSGFSLSDPATQPLLAACPPVDLLCMEKKVPCPVLLKQLLSSSGDRRQILARPSTRARPQLSSRDSLILSE